MTDIDDRDVLRLQAADDFEQALGFAGGQRRRRLVENDDAGVGAERLRDFDQLALALRQSADRR